MFCDNGQHLSALPCSPSESAYRGNCWQKASLARANNGDAAGGTAGAVDMTTVACLACRDAVIAPCDADYVLSTQ